MFLLIQIELYKIFRRPRTYIAFGAIAALIIMIQFGLRVDGQEYVDFMLQSLGGFDIEGQVLNGYLVCYIILQLMLIHVPLLVALVAGDSISGEANLGTIRLIFAKPYTRSQIIIAKFLATSVYTLLLLIWVAVLALFLSTALFGTSDFFLMKSSYTVILNSDDVFWRYLCAFCFAYLSLLTVAALGFFLSAFAENSIGPIVSTMSIIIFCTVLGTLNLPVFQKITPWLFTTHMISWKEFFDVKIDENNVAQPGTIQNIGLIRDSLVVLSLHIVTLLTGTLFVMNKKDILS
jgi:ABC-2 type transport system permease protein